MKALLIALSLLLATATFAQTPGYPQQPSSPQQTMPNRPLPPDQTQQEEMGPQSQSMTPAQVEEEIQRAFQAQPALSTAKLSVAANNMSVAVKGTVANERQHEMALRVATLHASGLQVVDRIKVQQ